MEGEDALRWGTAPPAGGPPAPPPGGPAGRGGRAGRRRGGPAGCHADGGRAGEDALRWGTEPGLAPPGEETVRNGCLALILLCR